MLSHLSPRKKFYLFGALLVSFILVALFLNFNRKTPGIFAVGSKPSVKGADTNCHKNEIERPVLIKDNKNEWRGTSTNTEIEKIAEDLKVTIYPEDLVNIFPDPRLNIGTTITINRAPIIILLDGNTKIETRSWVKTVREFLAEKEIVLGKMDKINPDLESNLKNGDRVVIARIGERKEQVEEIIKYKTIEKPSSDHYIGTEIIIQKGINGKIIKTFLLRYENNSLVSKIILNENVLQNVQNKIILYGTKKKITVRCRFNSTVEEAATRYNQDPNSLCRTMMCESNGNPYSVGGGGVYFGLYQYTQSFWALISPRAGFAGSSIYDATAQIYTTAWAWAHGYRGRWPSC